MNKLKAGKLHRPNFIPKLRINLPVLVMFLSVAVLIMIGNAEKVKAAPWTQTMGEWSKRKQVTLVNNSGAALHLTTTYTITLNTKELYDAGALQSDCRDLRVFYQPSATTATELKRNYVLAQGATNCADSIATKVVFPLQATILNGAKDYSYYFYYDNEAAAAYSAADALDAYNVGSKEATFVAPFNGTTTALAAGSGTPTTESGAIRYSGSKSALSFDGVNDGVGGSNPLSGVSDNFTVETWLKIMADYSGSNRFLFQLGGYPAYTCTGIILQEGQADGSGSTINVHYPCVSQNAAYGSSFDIGTWQHIAIVRNNGINNLYKNGILVDSRASNFITPAAGFNIIPTWRGGVQFDEFRVSNTARYTSNFTPQTSPFVRDEYTKLLLHFDENGDDPRNTGKAIDDSGNGNHGTITGAKYVSGFIGIDSGSAAGMTGYQSSQSYAGHEGVFIEEGTTNKVTNPSFEHSTYNTNWAQPSIFDYDSTADTFTAGMSKRNSAGPFAAGILAQGDIRGQTYPTDRIAFSTGTQLNNAFYTNFDSNQGSVVFWITPEWNGNDGKTHELLSNCGGIIVRVDTGNLQLYSNLAGSWYPPAGIDVSSWVAGNTYLVVARWDVKNKLDGTNYLSISANDTHSFGRTTSGAVITSVTCPIGNHESGYPANALIEGLTVYRRPLFDGTYGIDVGNGDEINQIWGGAIASSKDPTLVTGSWDVVFALPTNATTGALTTGTGNAWSHPHASNLLYTSTTNTGGFMMNGTYAGDGWIDKNGDTQTLTLQPDGTNGIDTYIYNEPGQDTKNYGAGGGLSIGEYDITKIGAEGYTRSLIKFDLSTLPANSTISSSVFSIYYYANYATNNRTLRVYRQKRPWIEGTRTGQADSPATGATAIRYDTTNNWQTSGAFGADDCEQTDIGSRYFTVDDTLNEFKDFPLTPLTKAGLDLGNGWLIKADTELNDSYVFASSDSTASFRPKLVVNYSTPPSVSVLSSSEKIFSGGYKFTSTGANQGISRSFTATAGGDYVLRAIGNSDGNCNPQVKITRADGTTEITHLNGSTSSTRTDPDVYIFTWESPAAENEQVQLINTAATGSCYWHQVEVLSNLVTNPSIETGSGNPWIPIGWANGGTGVGDTEQETTIVHSGNSSVQANPSATNIQINTNTITFTAGGFYSTGYWNYGNKTQLLIDPVNSNFPQQTSLTGSLTIAPATTENWNLGMGVFRAITTAKAPWLKLTNETTKYADDVYIVTLNPVSLTVTPATEANSTETSGLRIDGTDTLTQTIDSLTTTAGNIQFKYTPRHSAADVAKFGEATPYIATFWGNTNNYIKLYWSAANTVTLDVKANGISYSYPWDATGAIVAGTTYELKIAYDTTGISLKVNGVEKIKINTGLPANWWLSGGISSANAVAAYQAKGVVSQAASYVNLNNPGTNDATLFGNAPTWDVTNGWTGGTGKGLYATVVQSTNTVLCRFSGGTTAGQAIFGVQNAIAFKIHPLVSAAIYYFSGSSTPLLTSTLSEGVLGVGNGNAWRNGVLDGNPGTSANTETRKLAILGNNFVGTLNGEFTGSIQACAIYDSTITANQVRAVTYAMNDATISFSTVPTTTAWGSNYDGSTATMQGDATIATPAFNGTVTPTENTIAPYYKFGSKSVKLVASADGQYITSINPGNANTHTLSAYVYDGTSGNVGGTVSATIAKLVFNGNVVTPAAYTDMGGGWWRLTYSAATASAAGDYGVAPLSGKTIYVDGVQLEEKAYATTYADGTMGTGYAWTGTANNSTSTRTNSDAGYTGTGNFNPDNFSVGFWVKNNFNFNEAPKGGWNWGPTYFAYSPVSYQLNIGIMNSATIDFWAWTGGGVIGGTFGTPPNKDNWSYITLTFDGDTFKTYKNGAYVDQFTDGGKPHLAQNQPIYVGNGIGGYSNSTLSDLRIYSTDLSSTEVADLYYAGLGSHTEQLVATDRFTDGQPPVLAWHFDEGFGTTAYDSTLYANNGTISGATWNVDSGQARTTIGGSALQFDGTNDFISRAYSSDSELDPGEADMAVSLWFRHSSTAPAANQILLSRYNTSGYKVYMNTSGFICFGIDGDSTWSPADEACSTVSYADSEWHHMEAVKSGTTAITLYIDGLQVSQDATLATTTSISGNHPTLYVGINSDGTANPYAGQIDEVRVYNSASSAETVKTHFAARGSVKGVSASIGAGVQESLSQGLVGYWKMDEVSGTLADSSGNSNTGTWTGTGSSHYTTGKYSNGGGFNGTDDAVTANDSLSLNIGSAITISAWIKPTTYGELMSPERYGRIISKISGVSNRNYDFLVFDSTANPGALVYNTGASTSSSISNSNVVTLGEWQNVLVTYDGTTVKFYRNGVSVGTSTNTDGITTNNGSVVIGNLEGYTRHFEGSMDDVRIYNRALSPVEVRALYEYAPGPVAYWNMDEGNGQYANDKSGNNNTGTLGANSSPGNDDPTWTQGKYGQALSFDGSDYLNIGTPLNSSFVKSKAFSVGAWIKTSATSGESIVSSADWTSPYIGIEYTVNSSGNLVFDLVQSGSQLIRKTTSLTVNNGQWHYISVTYNGSGVASGVTLYIDGVVVATTTNYDTLVADATSITNLQIGARDGANTPYSGAIDDVKIYNYARSQKQIVQDMNAGHPAVGSPVGSAVGYWKFDEGQGITANNSGFGGSSLNGTLTNMSSPATATSGWTNSGKIGKGLVFDGSNDDLIVNDNAMLNFGSTNDFSLSAWFYTSNSIKTIFDKRLNSGVYKGYHVFLYSSGTPYVQLNDTGGHEYGFGTGSFNDSRWHHIIVTFQRSSYLNVYVDGIKQGTSVNISTIGDVTNTANLHVGGHISDIPGYGKSGSIDEVKIYNYALSEDEVKLDYNQGKTVVMGSTGTTATGAADNSASRAYCPPGNIEGNCAAGLNPAPVAEWNFDTGSGQSAVDTSGNANTGQLGSAPGVDAADPTWTNGKVGQGLKFDGMDDYVGIPYASTLAPTAQITFQAWVNTNWTSYSNDTRILSKSESGGYQIALNNSAYGNDNIDIYIYRNGAYGGVHATRSTLTSGWHFITGSYDGRYTRLYIDGVLKDTDDAGGSYSISYSYNNSLLIGVEVGVGSTPDVTGTSYFIGSIDQVKIYNYARTPAQIAWDYNRGEPVGHWKFDECSGATVHSTNDPYNSALNGTVTIGATGTQTAVGTCATAGTAWGNSATGKYNASLNFDGTDDWVSVADNANLRVESGNFSISVWVKPTVVQQQAILFKAHPNMSASGYSLIMNRFGNDISLTKNGVADQAVAYTFQPNVWYHISAVQPLGGNVAYYINGKLIGSYSNIVGYQSSLGQSFNIGDADTYFANKFSGQIDDARIYNYALTTTQIKDIFNEGAAVRF